MIEGIDVVRADLPATTRVAYLNTGTAGPIPRPTADVMADEARKEACEGRIGPTAFHEFLARLDGLRTQLSAFVGADPHEVGLTHNTTEGMNIGIWGHDWKPDDEVVTTTLEHGGALLPLYELHKRVGVSVTFAEIGDGRAEQTLEALDHALRPGVKLVVLSHVTYGTGAVLPLREIIGIAHGRDIPVLVDGAQSVGAIPVNMHALDVDYYAFPGQKWLLGPEGTGGLYVRSDRLTELDPTFTGFLGSDHDSYQPNDVAAFAPREGANRYETASVYRPGIAGFGRSLAWLTGHDLDGRVFEPIRQLAHHASAQVQSLPGCQVLTPEHQIAGLVAFRVDGLDLGGCVEFLGASGTLIRSIPDNGTLRISCGFFNTHTEIDRTIELIRDFRKVGTNSSREHTATCADLPGQRVGLGHSEEGAHANADQ